MHAITLGCLSKVIFDRAGDHSLKFGCKGILFEALVNMYYGSTFTVIQWPANENQHQT